MRYILQPYQGPASRYHCPQCQHRSKTFSRYIDTQNQNQQLADDVGRCSREDKCGYHFKPRDFFYELKIGSMPWANRCTNLFKPLQRPPTSYIADIIVNQSLKAYHHNNLYQYFSMLFGHEVSFNLFKLYRVGSSKHWPGATVFWQTDVKLRTRTGKVMLYKPQTGKRVKQPFNHITWAHRLLRSADYEMRNTGNMHEKNNSEIEIPNSEFILKQCLFGEHLLAHNDGRPIAIVESEKTALLACIHLPAFTWLATGGLHNLNYQTCKILQGRKVILFPDLNAAGKWQQKADELRWQLPGTILKVSRALEDNATDQERQDGLDIGDVLARGR